VLPKVGGLSSFPHVVFNLTTGVDIRALKAKVVQMIDRTRYEKELKLKAEADLASVKKKVVS
jgi:hypothetical protein